MRNKIIKYLQEEKRVINVRSEKQWIELMEYFEFYDIKFGGDLVELSMTNFWQYHKEKTIIFPFFLRDGELGHFEYSETNLVDFKTIILFKNFKKEFIEKDTAYQLHLAIKRVEELEKEIKEENQKYYARFKLKENNLNYLIYDKDKKTYGIASNWENQNHKSKFTKKELKELKVWDNPLFKIVEVED